ncbi:Protein of unknown function [Tistlia consotensis]|uniref:DUF3574 domain-containing protein n=1 Tax=Tistlia consotensis USBA 355 TaxID=560819 RepID=A0A1Y6CSW9_9PROT|nr:DUF3574 domain-containing protein [Tistlia consotensis]SMF75572.1 Protein of unknown function [Tistlia consotensis USBA 355]SNS07797.1 Protein of unknown function [Tistlia consotensis]
MPRLTRTPVLLAALLLLGACAPLPRPATPSIPTEPLLSCLEGGQSATEARLYFGRSLPGGGQVGETDWADFLDEEVTPRFPDGLTVLDGRGQWRADATAPVEKEASKLLVVVMTDPEAQRPRLHDVIEAYKARFHQQSVLLTTAPVCASF